MRNCTLQIEDFGKIDSAEIELAPLTLFVGDNNSGKSYLMTLIYGLFTGYPLTLRDLPGGPDTAYFENIFKNLIARDDACEHILSENDYARFERILNGLLERNKTMFLSRIFNKGIPIKKLQIQLRPSETVSFFVHKEPKFNDRHRSVEATQYLELHVKTIGQRSTVLESALSNVSSGTLFTNVLAIYLFQGNHRYTPIFLPASRTGFMLTYRSLVKHSIEKSFAAEYSANPNAATVLTKPCIDFLTAVSELSQEQYKCASRKNVMEFIETHIIQGKIAVNQMPTPDITYIPTGLNTELPLHISSGVVTEVTPLLLGLAKPSVDYLQIEEPEMCLHPGLQKEMARALIRTVNAGMPVLASTHSDIILQHVNNMIRLNKHPDREKIMRSLGYSEEDMIAQEDVRVYQFESNGPRSSVKRIDFDPGDGFPANTFIDSLSALLDETMQIVREDR
jgi:predicted ATPase